MCNLQVLTHNESGYVVQCEQCRHFQIAFGTTVVCFSGDDIIRFEHIAGETAATWNDDGFPDRKSIYLPLFADQVQLVVSFRELKQLQQMLAEALIMSETNKLLNHHDNSSSNKRHGC